jgi:carbon-monoxide dehydrogenase small subunit
MKISFILNGSPTTGETPPTVTALEFLRKVMGLASVKEGCGIGECGACTIIVDGRAIDACLLPAAKLLGTSVETVEYLSKDGQLHPIQRAFIKANAVQCGFCTPGMLMSAKALLDGEANPSPERIKKALAGNVCRCTGYQQIVEAVQIAAAEMQVPSLPTEDRP